MKQLEELLAEKIEHRSKTNFEIDAIRRVLTMLKDKKDSKK